jgi:hypothetical protein
MSEHQRIPMDTSIHIPPLTDEVQEAQRAYKAAWDAWTNRTAENYHRLQTDLVDASQRLNRAQYAAIGPWRVFG